MAAKRLIGRPIPDIVGKGRLLTLQRRLVCSKGVTGTERSGHSALLDVYIVSA